MGRREASGEYRRPAVAAPRATGSRAGERSRAVREGRASAHRRKRRPQRVASWRRTSCRMPPWWARRRAGEPPVRAPASALAPCARAGLPPVAGNAVLKGSRAGGGRRAGCRRGGRGGALANHRFARRRAPSRRARGPGFRPLPETPSSKGRELAEDVVQDAAVVGEAARWRTTGSRAGERPRAVREGRASARCRKRRPQRVASWRRT